MESDNFSELFGVLAFLKKFCRCVADFFLREIDLYSISSRKSKSCPGCSNPFSRRYILPIDPASGMD